MASWWENESYGLVQEPCQSCMDHRAIGPAACRGMGCEDCNRTGYRLVRYERFDENFRAPDTIKRMEPVPHLKAKRLPLTKEIFDVLAVAKQTSQPPDGRICLGTPADES